MSLLQKSFNGCAYPLLLLFYFFFFYRGNCLGCLNGCYAFAYTTNTVLYLPLISKKSVYINGLLMGHTQIVDFILKRGLIGAQIPNGLCRVLLVVCQQISSINTHFFYLKSYVYFGWSWLRWYGSWIFNYLCYQCLSPLKFWIQISRCTRYKLLW
jgi:hypothetical protein